VSLAGAPLCERTFQALKSSGDVPDLSEEIFFAHLKLIFLAMNEALSDRPDDQRREPNPDEHDRYGDSLAFACLWGDVPVTEEFNRCPPGSRNDY
jgi:hypothetical protein